MQSTFTPFLVVVLATATGCNKPVGQSPVGQPTAQAQDALSSPTPTPPSKPPCDETACKEKRKKLDKEYLRSNGGRREEAARGWWLMVNSGLNDEAIKGKADRLVRITNEGIALQHEVNVCEAQCEGLKQPAEPPTGCADLCTRATACEINYANAKGIDVRVPNITSDLFDCVEDCAFKRPLSPEDIKCWSSEDCATLAQSIRKIRAGECPGSK